MADSANNNKGCLPTCQIPKEDIEDDRRDSIRKRKRIIKTCLGIAIWILVCVPSNIMATLFYFKQIEISPGAMHKLTIQTNHTNLLININVTASRIYDHDRKSNDTKLNDSMKITNQVSLIWKVQ